MMDRILKICFCVILIGIYWIAITDSLVCNEVGYSEKCGTCAHDQNCPKCINRLRNIECRRDKRCLCMDGYGIGASDGLCLRGTIVRYGANCGSNFLCNGTDDFQRCSGLRGRCVCSDGYHRDEAIGRCIMGEGLIFDACSAQPDTCKEISALKCDKIDKICLVQKGYKYNCTTDSYEKGNREHNQTCNEASCSTAQPGCDPCNPDKHLECQYENGSKCVCKSGYNFDPNKGKCIAGSQQPGYPCNDNTRQCDPNEHLECQNGFCACIDGYALDETINNNKCVKMPGHDKDCSQFMCDPIDPNMVCNPETAKCECKEGYQFYTVLKKCVRYREYNETCEDISCNPKSNLECKSGAFCVCKKGFKYDENEKRCKEYSKWWMWFMIGFVAAVLLSFASLGSLWYFLYYRKNKKKKSPVSTLKEVKEEIPATSTLKEVKEEIPTVSAVKEVEKSNSKVTAQESSMPGKPKSKTPIVSRRLSRSKLIPSKKVDEALKGVGAW